MYVVRKIFCVGLHLYLLLLFSCTAIQLVLQAQSSVSVPEGSAIAICATLFGAVIERSVPVTFSIDGNTAAGELVHYISSQQPPVMTHHFPFQV